MAVPLVGMLLGSACFPEALPAYALPFMQVRVWWPAANPYPNPNPNSNPDPNPNPTLT